jgi:hypothetical protein
MHTVTPGAQLCCNNLQVLRLGSPSVLPTGDITWVEMRPSEQGRSVLTHWQVAVQHHPALHDGDERPSQLLQRTTVYLTALRSDMNPCQWHLAYW